MEIAVLIPCYNESKTIANVVIDYQSALPEATIYVYDNNSTDGSDEIARKAGAVVRYERRQGKGNVVRTMFREIDADCYLLVDGDDTYPATKAREMMHWVLEGNADMVIGDRLSSTYAAENKRSFHNAGNKLLRSLINKIFGGNLADICSGSRAMSYSFVKSFPVLSKGFEIETEMSIHALDKNMNVVNVVIPYRDREPDNPSKLNTYSDGMKALLTIVRLFKNYRPLAFFGAIAGGCLLVSGFAFLVVLAEYLQTGLVPRFPTLIVSGVLAVLGLLFLVCGVILDTVAQKHRQMFEIQLNLLTALRKKEVSGTSICK